MPLDNPIVINFEFDYKLTLSGSQAERSLDNFKFKGPGWYITETDTILVTPAYPTTTPWKQATPPDALFNFHVWNRTDLADHFNAIVNAPTRTE